MPSVGSHVQLLQQFRQPAHYLTKLLAVEGLVSNQIKSKVNL